MRYSKHWGGDICSEPDACKTARCYKSNVTCVPAVAENKKEREIKKWPAHTETKRTTWWLNRSSNICSMRAHRISGIAEWSQVMSERALIGDRSFIVIFASCSCPCAWGRTGTNEGSAIQILKQTKQQKVKTCVQSSADTKLLLCRCKIHDSMSEG